MFRCCLALMLAIGGSLGPSSGVSAVVADTPPNAPQTIVDAINAVREAHGLSALRPRPALNESSSSFALRLMRTEVFGHADRIQTQARLTRLGEVLAFHGGRDPAERLTVMRWLHSPPHRALLLSRDFRWVGAGLAVGRFRGRQSTIWVTQFGGP